MENTAPVAAGDHMIAKTGHLGVVRPAPQIEGHKGVGTGHITAGMQQRGHPLGILRFDGFECQHKISLVAHSTSS